MSDRPIPDWQVVPSNAGVHVHLNVLPSSVQVPSFPHGFGLQALISKDKDAINSDGIGMSTFMCYTYVFFTGITKYVCLYTFKSNQCP